ncbi:hypothetical protein [Phycicoccus sonneratiae]|uniref:Uncharacterized protein n=1 Tax=Phycicoccus sonneratiae TaxID=2807628 RepID=A0ABS2CHC8_9MICO|nr:hypothetical protein [Phycicoccus sonneraticus]MBM6399276.1 hypothetical protein [Phycicoccus sonneraticus]
MTTTATRRPAPTATPRRPPVPATPTPTTAPAARRTHHRSTRSARVAAAAVLGSVALTVPALTLLGRPDTATVDVVTSFLIIGVLEVVAARALWTMTHDRSHPAAHAALLGRLGYALLVVVGALVLLDDGTRGVTEFRQHWTSAAAVVGLGLLALAVAFWHNRIGARIVPMTLAAAGLAGMAVAVVPVELGPVAPVLPLVVGDLVLVVALAGRALGRRAAAPRRP